MKSLRAGVLGALLAVTLAAASARAADGAWQRVPQLPFPDLTSADVAMAFDASHDRMLMLGGYPDTPGAPLFALAALNPHPSDGAARVSFELPVRSPGALDVFDLAGRRVERHDLAAHEAGGHSLVVGAAARLRPGVYVVRLTHGGVALTRRLCVVR